MFLLAFVALGLSRIYSLPLLDAAKPAARSAWLFVSVYAIVNSADFVQRGELFLIPAIAALSPALLASAAALIHRTKIFIGLSSLAYLALVASIFTLVSPSALWWGLAALPLSIASIWKPRLAFVSVAAHMIGLSAGYIQLGLQWR